MDIDAACDMMEDLGSVICEKSFIKQRFAVEDKIFQVEKADSFEYTDPVDSSITRHQVPHAHRAEHPQTSPYVTQSLLDWSCSRVCVSSSPVVLELFTDSAGQTAKGQQFGST